MRRRPFIIAVGTLCVSLSAAAQTPAGPTKIAIKGYDAVAYFTVGKPTKGNPGIFEVWDGTRFLFASEENRRLFAANPDKYAPQFSGYCAASLAKGVKLEAEPEHWIISDGRLYLFAGPVSRDILAKDPTIVPHAQANFVQLK